MKCKKIRLKTQSKAFKRIKEKSMTTSTATLLKNVGIFDYITRTNSLTEIIQTYLQKKAIIPKDAQQINIHHFIDCQAVFSAESSAYIITEGVEYYAF